MMKATTRAMLETIGDAGFTVEIQSDGEKVSVTATDDAGETWRATADSELAAGISTSVYDGQKWRTDKQDSFGRGLDPDRLAGSLGPTAGVAAR